jgi:regulatory protein YycI of two-component signal transduction system YycFG
MLAKVSISHTSYAFPLNLTFKKIFFKNKKTKKYYLKQENSKRDRQGKNIKVPASIERKKTINVSLKGKKMEVYGSP